MRITEKDVQYVADLANLELTTEEKAQFLAQLDSILGYFEQLNELDTSKIEPMAQVLHEQSETETLREDAAEACFSAEVALANAPEKSAGMFLVPKVIER